MADVAQLRIEVDSKGIRVSRGELEKLSRTGGQTERKVKTATGRMRQGFDRVRASVVSLQGAFAALGGALVVRELIQSSIELQRINSALAVATGSSEAAAREFKFVSDEAERLGLNLRTSAKEYSSLAAAAKGTNLQGQATRDIFTGISEAATALNLSAEQSGGALTAIQQIISKGTVQAEELRGQLGERLPGAFQIAARAMGVTTQELSKLLQQGKIASDEFLPKFARELHKTFGGDAERAAHNLWQEINRLSNAFFDITSGGDVDGLASSVGDLADTLNDPEIRAGIQSIIQSIIRLTSLAAKAASGFAHFGESIGNALGYLAVGSDDIIDITTQAIERLQGQLQALPETTGSLGGGLIDKATVNRRHEIERRIEELKSQRESLRDLFGSSEDGPKSLDPISVTADAKSAGRTGGPAGGNTRKQSEAQRLIAQLQQEKALYGDLSNLEQARISLANGYYGPVTKQQAALILQLSREKDARAAAATQKQAEIDLADQLNQKEQDRIATVKRLTDTLATDEERAIAANERRLQLINANVHNEQRANELRARSWQRLTDDINGDTEQIGIFSRRASENIQDELGNTLEDVLGGHFDGILESWTQLLQQMAAQAAAAQLSSALFGKQGAGSGGGLLGQIGGLALSAVGSYFGGGVSSASAGTSLADAGVSGIGTSSGFGIAGARASGGPVSGGMLYRVNERGPEYFQPNTDGRIIPNHAISAPAANQTVNLDVQIVNEGNGQIQTTRKERSRGPDGREVIKLYVRSTLQEMSASGELQDSIPEYNLNRNLAVT